MRLSCRYCSSVPHHRQVMNLGPFCDEHWAALRVWVGFWSKGQLKGLDMIDRATVENIMQDMYKKVTHD